MSIDLLPANIAARIEPQPDGCWHWTGYANGYGRHHDHRNRARGQIGAHRLVYELTVGTVPTGFQVDHTCHNAATCPGGATCPHRRCVNPAHLEAVTPKVNNQRSNSPSAQNARRTHCVNGHPLNDRRTNRTQRRTCRVCLRAIQRVSGRPVTGNIPAGRYTIGELCAAEGINKRDLWVAERNGALPANVHPRRFGRNVRYIVTGQVTA